MTSVRLGKYQLIERIAYGGMAEVFKAKALGEAGFERTVAIKKLHSRYAEDREVVAMLQDEARLVSQLVHPNICQVFDLSRDEDSFFITMEYIDGRDLAAVMRKAHKHFPRALPYPAIIYVMDGLLDALDYAHRKRDANGEPLGIIHRDISPQNIIVSFEGDVKVIDFGIAKARTQSHRTEQGVIKGKFRYMSPEQARGEPIDHRTDIFAAGVVFYEMVLGRPHSQGLTDMQLLVNIQQGFIEPLDQIVPDIPATINALIERALAPDPRQRWGSAGEFRRQLDGYARSTGLHFDRQAMAELMQDLFPGSWQTSTQTDLPASRAFLGGSGNSRRDGTLELSASDLVEVGSDRDHVQQAGELDGGATVAATPMRVRAPASGGGASARGRAAAARQVGHDSGDRIDLGLGLDRPPQDPGIPDPLGPVGLAQDPSIPDPLAEPAIEPPPPKDALPSGSASRDKSAARPEKEGWWARRKRKKQVEAEARRETGESQAKREGPGLFKRVFRGFVWILQTAVTLAILGGLGYLGWMFLQADNKTKQVSSHPVTRPGATKQSGVLYRVTLDLSSRPEGARLFVQDRDTGVRTPTRLTLSLPSPVQIRLHKEGFPDWEQEIEFDEGETVHLVADLRRGHRIRRTRVGRRRFRSSGRRRHDETTGRQAGRGRPATRTGGENAASSVPGVLVVDANKKAWIYINDRRMDYTRASFRLKPGHYRVKVRHGPFSSEERVVLIKPDQRLILHFDVP